MSAVLKSSNFTDYKVADIGLADWGRKEIAIAADRDAGSDGDPRRVREEQAARRARASPARCT